MSSPLLIAEGLEKSYDGGRIRALAGVDVAIERGEFVSVVGPSGSGKSTLLHVLGALDRPDAGTVWLDGEDLVRAPRPDRIRARSIGFVFQMHNLLPTLSALENVEVPLRALRVPRLERRQRARTLLEAVGLGGRARHRPTQLSGGERQRVAVARALVNEPGLVLLDEPTGNLDRASGEAVIELLVRLRERRGLTLVLVTHDLGLAGRADRTLEILDGELVKDRGALG